MCASRSPYVIAFVAALSLSATPLTVRERISRDVRAALGSSEVQARLQEMGYNIAASTPAEHERLFRENVRSFRDIGKRLALSER